MRATLLSSVSLLALLALSVGTPLTADAAFEFVPAHTSPAPAMAPKAPVENAPVVSNAPVTQENLTPQPAPQQLTPVAKDATALQVDETPPAAATMASPSAVDMGSDKMVQGFGKGVPLGLALQQIAPPNYRYSFNDGITPGQRVTWYGGKPWKSVISELARDNNMNVDIVNNVIAFHRQSAAMPAAIAPMPMAAPQTVQAPVESAAPAAMPSPAPAIAWESPQTSPAMLPPPTTAMTEPTMSPAPVMPAPSVASTPTPLIAETPTAPEPAPAPMSAPVAMGDTPLFDNVPTSTTPPPAMTPSMPTASMSNSSAPAATGAPMSLLDDIPASVAQPTPKLDAVPPMVATTSSADLPPPVDTKSIDWNNKKKTELSNPPIAAPASLQAANLSPDETPALSPPAMTAMATPSSTPMASPIAAPSALSTASSSFADQPAGHKVSDKQILVATDADLLPPPPDADLSPPPADAKPGVSSAELSPSIASPMMPAPVMPAPASKPMASSADLSPPLSTAAPESERSLLATKSEDLPPAVVSAPDTTTPDEMTATPTPNAPPKNSMIFDDSMNTIDAVPIAPAATKSAPVVADAPILPPPATPPATKNGAAFDSMMDMPGTAPASVPVADKQIEFAPPVMAKADMPTEIEPAAAAPMPPAKTALFDQPAHDVSADASAEMQSANLQEKLDAAKTKNNAAMGMQVASATLPPPTSLAPTPVATDAAALAADSADLNAQQDWQGAKDATMRQVIGDWSARAGVSVVWSSEYDYPLQTDVHIQGTYPEAIRTLLAGFAKAEPRPLARLFKNQSVGGKPVLVVETERLAN